MFYLLQKSYLHIQECVIEADSLEDAIKKAKKENSWYWREEFLDSEGYRVSEDEEDVHGEDYVPLDDIKF